MQYFWVHLIEAEHKNLSEKYWYGTGIFCVYYNIFW